MHSHQSALNATIQQFCAAGFQFNNSMLTTLNYIKQHQMRTHRIATQGACRWEQTTILSCPNFKRISSQIPQNTFSFITVTNK